jgi:SAM-dependent methyltransferase
MNDVVRPHATAIHRREASLPARTLVPALKNPRAVTRILDFGCGYGEDVAFYTRRGYQATGYDRHEPFGYASRPTGRFDLITLIYVLNVLPSPDQRLDALRDAAQFLTASGVLLAVTRSARDVEYNADHRKWPPHADGYWSDRPRGMFQHGLDLAEIRELGEQVGLGLDALTAELPPIRAATRALLRKEPQPPT